MKLGWTLIVTLSLGPSLAVADDDESPRVTVGDSLDYGSVRGVSEDWMILPQGLELGSELKFITSAPSLGAEPIAFSDVAIMTLHLRRSLAEVGELYASIDVLPKQPSWSEERMWQGASLGLRAQLGKKPAAFGIRASGGPMLAELGMWGQGAARLDARKRITEIMTFEGAASAAGTYLAPKDDARDPAWLVEGAVTGSVLFRDPGGHFGGWLGVGYALPIAQAGRDPMTGVALDPQPRLDLHVGGVVTLERQWDLFVDYAVIDRGDMTAMATRLPILDGGFDQRQIILGLNYHVKENEMGGAMIMD
jgi:hypothetical protein